MRLLKDAVKVGNPNGTDCAGDASGSSSCSSGGDESVAVPKSHHGAPRGASVKPAGAPDAATVSFTSPLPASTNDELGKATAYPTAGPSASTASLISVTDVAVGAASVAGTAGGAGTGSTVRSRRVIAPSNTCVTVTSLTALSVENGCCASTILYRPNALKSRTGAYMNPKSRPSRSRIVTFTPPRSCRVANALKDDVTVMAPSPAGAPTVAPAWTTTSYGSSHRNCDDSSDPVRWENMVGTVTLAVPVPAALAVPMLSVTDTYRSLSWDTSMTDNTYPRLMLTVDAVTTGGGVSSTRGPRVTPTLSWTSGSSNVAAVCMARHVYRGPQLNSRTPCDVTPRTSVASSNVGAIMEAGWLLANAGCAASTSSHADNDAVSKWSWNTNVSMAAWYADRYAPDAVTTAAAAPAAASTDTGLSNVRPNDTRPAATAASVGDGDTPTSAGGVGSSAVTNVHDVAGNPLPAASLTELAGNVTTCGAAYSDSASDAPNATVTTLPLTVTADASDMDTDADAPAPADGAGATVTAPLPAATGSENSAVTVNGVPGMTPPTDAGAGTAYRKCGTTRSSTVTGGNVDVE